MRPERASDARIRRDTLGDDFGTVPEFVFPAKRGNSGRAAVCRYRGPAGGAKADQIGGSPGGGLFGEQKFNRAGSTRLTNSEVFGQAI